jgi:hypothetical protein
VTISRLLLLLLLLLLLFTRRSWAALPAEQGDPLKYWREVGGTFPLVLAVAAPDAHTASAPGFRQQEMCLLAHPAIGICSRASCVCSKPPRLAFMITCGITDVTTDPAAACALGTL